MEDFTNVSYIEEKLNKRTLYIMDIDGTLLDSAWGSKELIKDVEKISKMLKKGVPYQWVLESDIFKNSSNIIVFVTGRVKEYHEELTMKWLKEKIGCDDFEIRFVGFNNYDQYVKDKIKEFDDVISKYFDSYGSSLLVNVYEDSDTIIKETIRKIVPNYPMKIDLFRVEKGIVSRVLLGY